MDYEEKHKEDLESAKGWLAIAKENNNNLAIQTLEKLFPELCESEDEIFKELLHNLIVSNDYTPSSKEIFSIYGKTKEDCLVWLEKQGKQKPADKIEPKFKVGDWVINNDKRIAVPTQILEIEKYGYVTSRGYISFGKVKTDYHLLAIQDAKERFVQANHWKPSKEQKEAIKYFIDFHRPQANASTEGWKEFKYLESLYNNIKRL